MGLLFVFGDDEQATAAHVDVSMADWEALLAAATSSKGDFPLVRRLNEFYRDARFDHDELEALVAELERLQETGAPAASSLASLARAAHRESKGILAIAD